MGEQSVGDLVSELRAAKGVLESCRVELERSQGVWTRAQLAFFRAEEAVRDLTARLGDAV